MPGLIRGVARTAVVAGTATAVSNRVSRRQAERWSQQDYEQQQQAQQQYAAPEPPPAAPAAGMESVLDQLKQLGELRDAGVLTEAEFEAQKAKLLG
jgi:phosphoglycolate phosphatase-like HAD superfamily hydrolase